MIGLDTNVLVRYLAQDGPKQALQATRLIEHELTAATPGFISLVVLAELCWVLTRLYGASPDEIKQTVEDLLGTPQFHVERREVVQAAVRRAKGGKTSKAGFVDALITQAAEAEGCSHTVTFDKAAVRGAGMTLLV
ncbi:PIN domain-containing protein [Ramlibacter sp. WS9]|uniref:PIN domain-containing protein n=1 Tax=Ramlibacter sp. WS9 TaxID=1882741 RepID=UPI001142E242|nr:type II toxin-antitoxin system VapC family toxin [Ramlibacter sp. WS9]ROZ66227.1 PIN domain-containing protein [Ramlibacter sp. WS9]